MQNIEETISESPKYLTFMLDGDEFALEISSVREVIEEMKITNIPRMPDFFLGVINLRGSILPVFDLRLKLGIRKKNEKTGSSATVVFDIIFDKEANQIGVVVDEVREVLEFISGNLLPPPPIGSKIKSEFIKGIGRYDDNFIMVLDIVRLFSESELLSISSVFENTADEND